MCRPTGSYVEGTAGAPESRIGFDSRKNTCSTVLVISTMRTRSVSSRDCSLFPYVLRTLETGPLRSQLGAFTIRMELIKGRTQGRYVSDNGRWSLAATETSAASPAGSASSDSSPGVAPGGEEEAGGVAEDSGGTGTETAGESGKGTLRLNL